MASSTRGMAAEQDVEIIPQLKDDMNKGPETPTAVAYTDEQLEDGYYLHEALATTGFRRTNPWWRRIAARIRNSLKDDDAGSGTVFLGNVNTWDKKSTLEESQRRSRYNFCVFAGISGTSILALLLLVNFVFVLANLLWAHHSIDVLSNWGQPGTGTEGLAWYPTDFLRDVQPIGCHSHNDYWRKVPLFSALRAGCIGVEADVWLFNDDLYVGHDLASLNRMRTFQSLYIDPLVEILDRQNPQTEFANTTNHGVFDVNPEQSLALLVDVKTGGAETWAAVLEQLQPLRERGWLTFVENGVLNRRPIIVVGTGNTPFDVLTANKTYRDAFFDAPLGTMWESVDASETTLSEKSTETTPEDFIVARDAGQGSSGITPSTDFNELNSYYASVPFPRAVGALWRGRLSSRQIEIIRGQVRGAHRRGLKVRYWNLPSWPLGLRNHVWDVLVKEGVDYLNVDDLRGASKQVW